MADQYKDYTAVLRIASGQEAETDFVMIEHAYSKPINWNPGLSSARLRKTLFISRVVKDPVSIENNDDIDVVTVSKATAPLPYDIDKAKHVMNECKRHVRGISQSEDDLSSDDDDAENEIWEEKVDRSFWSSNQNEIFENVVKILDSHHLARLALSGTENEPVRRRAVVDKAAAKFRRLFAKIRWDNRLTQWIHGCLLQHLPPSYLAAYIDVLQTLKSKIPTLVDKMIALAVLPKTPRVDSLNLLLKRPWDPALPSLNQSKPKKLEKMPIIIIVPNGACSPNLPQASRRNRFFNTQLQHLAKSIPVNVTATPELSDAKSILDCILQEVRAKIVDCRRQFQGQPIILLGWGIGAILAAMISLNEKVDAMILLGFPMHSHAGKRGEADDILLDVTTPSLFIIGSKALNTTIDDVEDFRHRLNTITSLVVISDAEAMLKISNKKQYWEGLTQSLVDRCIVDEIGDFLSSVLCDEAQNPLPAVQTTASNVVVESQPPSQQHVIQKPKTTREVIKKRKLSPVGMDTAYQLQMPSKVFRAGTNLSQQLGLKIPLGNSASSTQQTSEVVSNSTGIEGQLDSDVASPSKKTDASSSFLGNILLNPVSKSSSRSPQTVSKPTSAASLTTISIGGLASVSKQRYQCLFQANEEAFEDTDSERSEFARPPKTASLPATSNKRGRPPTKLKGLGRGLSDTKPIKHYGRGRPPGAGRAAVAEKAKVSLATEEDTSMAVLTFTGGATDGETQDKIEGLSTVGRGFLTLGKGGGTSSVRVFSTTSGKMASQKTVASGESSPFIKINTGATVSSIAGAPSFITESKITPETIKVSSMSNVICIEKGSDPKKTKKQQLQGMQSLCSLPQISIGQMPVSLQGISAGRVVSAPRTLIPKICTSGKSTVMVVTSSSTTIPFLQTSTSSKANIKPVVIKSKDSEDRKANETTTDSIRVSIDEVTSILDSQTQGSSNLTDDKNKDSLHSSSQNNQLQLSQLKASNFGKKADPLSLTTRAGIIAKHEMRPIVVSSQSCSTFPSFISSSKQKLSFAKVVKSSGVQLLTPNVPSQSIQLSAKSIPSGGIIFKAPLKNYVQEAISLSSFVASANPVITDVKSVQPITKSGIVTKKVVISKKVYKEANPNVLEERIGLQPIASPTHTVAVPGSAVILSPDEELNLVLEQTADALSTSMDTEPEGQQGITRPNLKRSISAESSAKRRLSEIKVSITTPSKSSTPVDTAKSPEVEVSSGPTIDIDDSVSEKTVSKPYKQAKSDSISRITRATSKMAGSTRRGRPFRSNM